jgi:hypothetical protein
MALLAIDLGLKTGLALYGRDGRLQWYRSQNFGSVARLKRGAHGVVSSIETLEHLVAEGDRKLGEIWGRLASRRGASVRIIGAHTWRQSVYLARHRRQIGDPKRFADEFARRVVSWSKAPQPTSLRHDAAEAILAGLWGVLEVGWLDALPQELR